MPSMESISSGFDLALALPLALIGAPGPLAMLRLIEIPVPPSLSPLSASSPICTESSSAPLPASGFGAAAGGTEPLRCNGTCRTTCVWAKANSGNSNNTKREGIVVSCLGYGHANSWERGWDFIPNESLRGDAGQHNRSLCSVKYQLIFLYLIRSLRGL